MSDTLEGVEKEDVQTALAMLRALRGWSQADLAQATGLGASAISRYESGAQEPSRRTFNRIILAVGLRPPLVWSLLAWIRRARTEVLSGASSDPVHDLIEASALDLAEAFSAMLRSAVADLEVSTKRVTDRTPEQLWKEMEEVPDDHWVFLVEAIDDLHSWQFCAFLCDKSLEAAENGNRAEALQIAGLAVRCAELSREPGEWKLCLEGYAQAHLAAALQVSGDLDAAEEAMQQARALWEAGEPGESLLLDERRLVKIESALLAERART